jgi:hypothetical protein
MLTPAENVALAKLLKKAAVDASRDQLPPGQYPVDFAVRVNGTITVGEDYPKAATASLSVKEVIALFIVHAGIVVSDATMAALVAAVKDSIEDTGKSAGVMSAAMPMVEAALARVQTEVIDKLPKVTATGPVTTKLVLTQLQPEAAAAAV